MNALLVYEDVTVALRGNEVLRRLHAELKPQFELHNALWKFDLLEYPELMEQATQEALEANLFIIAAHGRDRLPAQVADWIEKWLPVKREQADHAAIIALLGRGEDLPEGGHEEEIRDQLFEIAKEGRMDFFCNLGGDHQASFHPYSTTAPKQELGRNTAPIIADVLAERWGNFKRVNGKARSRLAEQELESIARAT